MLKDKGQRVYTPAAIAEFVGRSIVALPITCYVISGLDFNIGKFRLSFMTVDTSELDHSYDPVHLGKLARGLEEGASSTRNSTVPPSTSGEINGQLSQPEAAHLQHQNNVTERVAVSSENANLSLLPRFLCFVTDAEKKTYETRKVSEYLRENGFEANLEFVFVSYTRLQFRIATDAEIDMYNYPDERTREANRELAKHDRATLISWGIEAAIAAGKPAFWLDFECIRDVDGVTRSSSTSMDVYHICDIVRAAHSMIIALGPDTNAKVQSNLSGNDVPQYSPAKGEQWLKQWGTRLWTLPEVLLCPKEHRIKLFFTGLGPKQPMVIAKRNFAVRAWDKDVNTVSELMNHHEGSVNLHPVNLLAYALECFTRRGTDQLAQGDVAYAIMGLVSHLQRPKIVHSDSGFRAFAKLSLAYDDGQILARLMCLSPKKSNAVWSDTSDFYETKLKDIRASCRVVEITDDEDALVIDDLHGATIHWDRISGSESLDFLPDLSLWFLDYLVSHGLLKLTLTALWFAIFGPIVMDKVKELLGEDALRSYQDSLVMACGLDALWHVIVAIMVPIPFLYYHDSIQAPHSPLQWNSRTGIAKFVARIFFLGWMPFLLLFRIKILRHPPKARLIGIEGAPDLSTIERHLWGFNWGKLRFVDLDADSDDQRLVNGLALDSSTTRRHTFTLVDTRERAVTRFRSNNPPVAMLIGGQEGSEHRAMLCSYDYKADIFHRERVIRVSSDAYDMTHKVNRLRLSLRPSDTETDSQSIIESHAGETSGVDIEGATGRTPRSPRHSGTTSPWTTWQAFLFVMFVSKAKHSC